MSVILSQADGQEFELSDAGWQAVIELGKSNGWRPAEILEELTPPFRLNDRDAAALAEVVTTALPAASMNRKDASTGQMFTARSAGHWRRFAEFCRRGGFIVAANLS